MYTIYDGYNLRTSTINLTLHFHFFFFVVGGFDLAKKYIFFQFYLSKRDKLI